MDQGLYQKIGVIISQLAQEFLTMEIGDRVPSISEYQEQYQVSRGTIQNAFSYLKEHKGITLRARGHMGTYIEDMDLLALQRLCMGNGILGVMPLPYAASYEGLATALYEELSSLDFNMAYTRGAENRIELVEKGVYDFAICSRHAAAFAVEKHDVEVIIDFGPGSYLSKHVLILREPTAHQVVDGMRVAYDKNSLDQREITKALIQDRKDIQLIEMRAHQTVGAIMAGEIDAGIWNYDEIVENGYTGLNMKELDNLDISRYSAAVMLIRRGAPGLEKLFRRFIDKDRVLRIQQDVRSGKHPANF